MELCKISYSNAIYIYTHVYVRAVKTSSRFSKTQKTLLLKVEEISNTSYLAALCTVPGLSTSRAKKLRIASTPIARMLIIRRFRFPTGRCFWRM